MSWFLHIEAFFTHPHLLTFNDKRSMLLSSYALGMLNHHAYSFKHHHTNLYLAGTVYSQFFHHTQTFLFILLPGHPETVLVFHYISQHSSTQEYHVFPTRWILNTDLKFLSKKNVYKIRTFEIAQTDLFDTAFSLPQLIFVNLPLPPPPT